MSGERLTEQDREELVKAIAWKLNHYGSLDAEPFQYSSYESPAHAALAAVEESGILARHAAPSGLAADTEALANRDGETDVRPWRPNDGDLRCQSCGHPNVVWYADNDTWNRIMPDGGILCIPCFIARTERLIGTAAWALFVDPAPFMGEFKRGFEAGRSAHAQVNIAQVRADALAEIEALMEVAPRDFDAKRAHPDMAYRRCKQPNCSIEPWGLGTVTQDSRRFCAYHQGLADARAAIAKAKGGEQGE